MWTINDLLDRAAKKLGYTRDAPTLAADLISTSVTAGITSITGEKTYAQLVDSYKSWVYTSIDKISKSVASLHIHLYVYRDAQGRKILQPGPIRQRLMKCPTQGERKSALQDMNVEKEEVFDHPVIELLNKPNGIMTRFMLWYETMVRLELGGTCGWYIPKNGLGLPGEVWPLPLTKTASLSPKITTKMEIEYWTYRDGQVVEKFPPDEILFLKYPHPAGPFQGMSPLMAQAYPYDIDLYLMQQQKALFENRAIPGLALSTDQPLTADQVKEIKQMLDAQYAGAVKAGKPLVTHSGLKIDPAAFTGREMMIGEVERIMREKMITAFDLSEGKLGLVRDVNRANMEALNESFVNDCLKPKTMLIEEIIEAFLLPRYDVGLTMDFELPDLADRQMNITERTANLTSALTTINEERGKMGLDPVEWGEVPWLQSSLYQYGDEPPAPAGFGLPPGVAPPKPGEEEPEKPPKKKPKPKPDEDEEEEEDTPRKREAGRTPSVPFSEKRVSVRHRDRAREAFVRKIRHHEQDATGRMRGYFRRVEQEVLHRLNQFGPRTEAALYGRSRRSARQHIAAKNVAGRINISLERERERLEALMRPVLRATLDDGGSRLMRSLGLGMQFNVNDPKVVAWLGDRLDQFSNSVSGTTFDDIDRILREGWEEGLGTTEIADRLRETFDSFESYRAPLIARTETASAANKSDILAIRQAGLQKDLLKTWITAQDERVRDSHREAEERYEDGIPMEDNFVIGGDEMDAPGNGSDPAENINCRCSMVYIERESGDAATEEPPAGEDFVMVPADDDLYAPQEEPPPLPTILPPEPSKPAIPDWATREKGAIGKKVNYESIAGKMSTNGFEAQATFERAFGYIDTVHDDGPLLAVNLEWNKRDGGANAFYAAKQPGAKEPIISVNLARDADQRIVSAWHEVGHWLDNWGIRANGPNAERTVFNFTQAGTEKIMATEYERNLEPGGILHEWWTAVQNSDAYKELVRLQGLPDGAVKVPNPGMVGEFYGNTAKATEYYLMKTEILARSYSQYMAMKVGDTTYLGAIESRLSSPIYASGMWTRTDFRPIYEAMDKMFDDLGWLKMKGTG